MHQAVVESRAFPPRKPDKRCVRHVTQPEFPEFTQRMSLGRSQCDVVQSDLNLIQLPIRFRHVINKARVQPARPHTFKLFQTRQRV